MKKRLWVLCLVSVLALGIFCATGISAQKAYAGTMNAEDVQGALNSKGWVLDRNVTVKSGKVTFAKNTVRDARFLSRTKIYADFSGSIYDISAHLAVSDMTAGKRFGIGVGFGRLSYVVGDANTTFIYVEKSGNGFVVGVCSYDENKKVTEHLTQKVALTGSEWDFEVTGTYPNVLKVAINEQEIFEGAVAAEGITGYYGFMETGASTDDQYCVATVNNVSVSNNFYDRPENVNIYDDFNEDFLDTSIWSLYNDAAYLKGVAVDGTQLRFIDSNQSSVSTQYQYSNFELNFDIPYIQREPLYNQDGTFKTAVCNWIGFICGINASDSTAILGADYVISNYPDACFLSFKGNYDNSGNTLGGSYALFGPAKSRVTYTLPDNYDIWNIANEDRTLNVAFTCIDGVYSLGIKWDDETDYYHVFTREYKLNRGYITFLGYGAGANNNTIKANFALDNIKITNRDYEGNVLTDIEKTSGNILENTGDYGYVDSKLPAQLIKDGTDFDNLSGGKSGCNGAVGVGGVFMGLFGVMFAIKKLRCKK